MKQKKWYFIVGALLVVAIILAVVKVAADTYSVKPDVSYTFDYITHGHLSDVKYITTEADMDVNITTILDDYNKGEYKLWEGEKGSTKRVTFYFADANSDVIFAVVELGNQNLIQILVDDTTYIYQKQ